MSFYGRFFRGARVFAKWFLPVDESPAPDPSIELCVFICRHKNLQGPLYTMVNLQTPVHPWVLDVFCDKDHCYRHYRDYTFTARYGWPRWLAIAIARLASAVIPRLMRSLGGIPVYRGSARITTTYRKTLAALQKGECVIIYPDVKYTDTSDGDLELYQGYLLLDRLYRRACGGSLPFVPLYVDAEKRRIVRSEPILFDGAAEDQAAETRRVGEAIRAALIDLANQSDEQAITEAKRESD